MTITARYPGRCRNCGGFIAPGTKVICEKGKGVAHVACPAGRPAQPATRRKPETKVCWECGGIFTFADCKRNGGDWYDSYCGC
jgi:hypothetical protein